MSLSDYPEWWYEKNQKNEIPWNNYQGVNLPTFLSRYTLHDSYLAGIEVDPWASGHVTFVIRPDVFWWKLPDKLPKPIVLLLRFAKVYQMNWSGPKSACSSVITVAESRQVPNAEKERFLDLAVLQTGMSDEEKGYILAPDLYHTYFLIEDIDRISLYHSPDVAVLTMGEVAEAIVLPLDPIKS